MNNRNDRHKKVRTPYPVISFEKAYNYLCKIRNFYPRSNHLTKAQLVKALDLSSTSGTAHTALGSLSHYGFAYKTGSQQNVRYQLTDLALKLAEPQDSLSWKSSALESATIPETFNFLYSYHEHDSLPADIENQLIRRYDGVTTKNVTTIIKLFYDSMDFIDRNSLKNPASQKQHEFSLGNGVVISATEEVIVKALRHYLKDFDLD